MEHIKWIFDGFGVVIVAGLIRYISKLWQEREKRKNLLLVVVFSLLLIAIIVLQYYLFEGYWIKYIILNRLEIALIMVSSIIISLILSYIYQSTIFLAIKNEYVNIKSELEKNNIELKQELELVKSSDNFIDNVTGLPNSKALEHILLERVNRCKDKNVPLSLLMVDIDGFRNINKAYSVQGADFVLKSLAQYLQKLIRKEDRILRFRVGDEFLIIAFDTNEEGATGLKKRIKKQVIREDFTIDNNQIKISVAVGISEYNFDKPFSDYELQTNETWKALEQDKADDENSTE